MSAIARLERIAESMKSAALEAHAHGMKCIEWHARLMVLSDRITEEEAEAMILVLQRHGLIGPLDIPTV